MSLSLSLTLNGQPISAAAGETILDAAKRAGVTIPTLCHDPRLKPAGACRTCLVEVKGERRLHPACAFPVRDAMEIQTESARITRHRQTLLSLYAADHRLNDTRHPDNELESMLDTYGTSFSIEALDSPRAGREDPNPYITFDEELCILCARCTRYCDEVEAVNAIGLTHRGSHTTISTVLDQGLMDTTCELCGGCIDTCPTGALTEKKALDHLHKPLEKIRTTCNYCGVGCQMDLNVADNKVVKVTSPPPGETVNDGNLCVKGRFAYDFIHHKDRLTTPLVRVDGQLQPTTWEDAIQRVAKGLLGVKKRWGANALGFVSSSRCTGEENYLMQKLARAAFGTNNCHQCAAT